MGITGAGQVQELQEYISTRNTGHLYIIQDSGQDSQNMIITRQEVMCQVAGDK